MLIDFHLVSIIMPAFNAGKYIKKSIDSVLLQSYTNWELIIINDGSTDNTIYIVEQYNDSRIKILNQTNQGVAQARNTGIFNSKGYYIAFLDSDDVWLENKLEVQIKFMVNNPNFILSYTDYYSFVNNEKIINNKQLLPFKIEKIEDKLLVFNFIPTLTVMVISPILKKLKGFDINLFGPEDWELWIRISDLGDFYFIDQKLAMYREHVGGISKNKFNQLLNEYKVLKLHVLQSGNVELIKCALWFHYLKFSNYYFSQKKIILSFKFYFKMIFLFPFKTENYTYPLKRFFFNDV